MVGRLSQNKNKINYIRNKDVIISESKFDICNEFNDCLVNVQKILDIKHKSPDTFFIMIIHKNDSIFLKQIDKDDIIKPLDKIKNHNSYFENDLMNLKLKSVSESISLSLYIIFNKSLPTVKYPTAFKNVQ